MVRRAISALLVATVLPLISLVSPVQAQDVRAITLPIAADSINDVYWSDTYGACRAGCSRSHQGVDIMGPKMTPLVAAADGVVSWMRHDTFRGNNLNITDDDGWTYHYVHINNDTPGTDDAANEFEFAFAPGIERGARVTAGQLVGYLGDSGNAESTGAHLHFEITRPDGSNINPTASVNAARINLVAGVLVDELGGDSADELKPLIDEMSEALIGRTLSAAEIATLIAEVEANGLGVALEEYVDVDSEAASIDRLYKAFFLRLPDSGGLRYWIEQKAAGNELDDLADVFAASPEFQQRYADVSFSDFLDQLYEDVLFRDPDIGGRDYWLELLEDGTVTKGSIVVQFTESVELKALTGTRSEAIALYNLFEGRIPSDAEVADWVELRRTTSLTDAIEGSFALSSL